MLEELQLSTSRDFITPAKPIMRSLRLRASPAAAAQQPPPSLPHEADPLHARPDPPVITDTDTHAKSDMAHPILPAARATSASPPPPYDPDPALAARASASASPRCALLPHRAAQWRVKGRREQPILLSTLAATVLVSERQLEGAHVELLQDAENAAGPADPLSGIAIATYSTISEVVLGVAAGPREAYRQVLRAREDRAVREAQEYQPCEQQEDEDEEVGEEVDAPSVSDAASSGAFAACPTPLTGSESGTLRAESDARMAESDAGTAVGAKENPYAAVALSTGKGVARIVGAGLKAPGAYTYGLSRGLNNVPRLYGDETAREEEKIDGVVTGLAAAGKGLGYGLYDGITGFFVQPVKGAQKEGAVGFLKGFGKGLGGIVCKPAAGACGVPGAAFTGIQRSIEKQLSRKGSPEECLAAKEVLQGEDELRHLSDKERSEIVCAWLARAAST